MPTVSFFHCCVGLGIGDAAPQVDDPLAADGERDRRADLAAFAEKLRSNASATRSKPRAAVPSIFMGRALGGALRHRQP